VSRALSIQLLQQPTSNCFADLLLCYACCSACEIQLDGSGPWRLPDGGEDTDILFTPGHTAGCISMLYKPQQVCACVCEF
jgi:hypothetical protein